MDYDLTEIPENYDVGRAYSGEAMQLWLQTISAGVAGNPISRILDLGCGTGRYSDEEFRGGVDGVRRHGNGLSEENPVIELIDFFVFRRSETAIPLRP